MSVISLSFVHWFNARHWFNASDFSTSKSRSPHPTQKNAQKSGFNLHISKKKCNFAGGIKT